MRALALALLWPGLLAAQEVSFAPAEPAAISGALAWVQPDGGDQTEEYGLAALDLNGDSQPEALVRIRHRATCDATLTVCLVRVLRGQPQGNWQAVGDIRALRLVVLPGRHHGWHDLQADGQVWRASSAAGAYTPG